MIKAYLAGIASLYEGEDIEVRYRIFEDEKLLCKENIMLEYRKPIMVGLISLKSLLRELEKHRDEDIEVIINDGGLFEFIRGTSGKKDRKAQELAKKLRSELDKFSNIEIKNISGDNMELKKWDEILRA